MGTKIGIWLDCERAHIIALSGDKAVVETVESEVETRMRFEGESKSFTGRGGALFNPSKKRLKRRKHQIDSYMERVLKRIADAEEVLIFGPAETKNELKKSILRHKRAPVLSVESADKMTERQMVARVREHFNQ